MDFVQAYNRVQMITGVGARKSLLEFQCKYNICGIECVNFNERLNQPEKKPLFQIQQCASLMEFSIWGSQINEYYIVVPNPQNYVGFDHEYGGMKELFESNFQYGNTYNKIKVNQVAIMTQNLQILKRGSLKLSQIYN